MAAKQVEYIIRIGPDERYRHLHIKKKGKIIYFRVQYETRINRIWHVVARYDTAHGFAHRDLMNIHGGINKTPLFNQDYNDALTFAENDLKTNWQYYKRRYKEKEND